MKENELRKIISMVCDGYTDSVIAAIEEDSIKYFPITIAVWHFIVELREKNIIYDACNVFDDRIIDRIYREIGNYIGR